MTRFVRTTPHGDGVVEVRLDRPDRLNAVSDEVYADLVPTLEAAADDPQVVAVLLTGAGRAFCAGADLKAHATRDRDEAQRRAYIWAGQRACRLIQTMDKPVVAAVQGHAIGAGAELAISADVLVCAEDARLRFPEVGLGTFVGGGASHRLPRLVGAARAGRLLLLGYELSGAEALAWGLAAEVVPGDQLAPRAVELARHLAAQPRLSMRLMKLALAGSGPESLDAALVTEAEALLACMASEDWDAAVDRFESHDARGTAGEGGT